ncbi:ATP-binding cassette domain-containing protein [Frankia sp. AgB1.9]|uniref:metal ABC transporter ATP-binding protein n=1 Tax=unclassified Frankia TaxID=2632575 RepID=UPI0027DDC3D4|nr:MULTISPECIES: ATP-binding cassette domain-containing protein [unclassified Frankia]MBL7487533.1 ATP-binding cassette domain-containing protein [Frankia sp. AgW1.1]MBL7549504.1 ATP-binding cassette domain-containing protein [Frankia sp. AgB1.9]
MTQLRDGDAAVRNAPPPPRHDPATGPRQDAAPAPARSADRHPPVEIRGAAVALGGRTVWSGVDATVPAGAFVAVLGPNGAGKSTLLKATLGLLPLTAGSIHVLGRPPRQVSDRVGYLPQRRSFDPSTRIRGTDVVRLGVDGDRWGIPLPGRRSRVAAARVRELVGLVGATSYAHRPIGTLSGGEQQRLLIAQALAAGPELLLLDEPLDSLDLPNQAAVAALVSRIARQTGIAVMIVAHDVNPLLPYLDQVIYLGHQAAATGTPTQVITSETLSALYGAPVEVLTASDGRLVVVGQPEPPARHTNRHPDRRDGNPA